MWCIIRFYERSSFFVIHNSWKKKSEEYWIKEFFLKRIKLLGAWYEHLKGNSSEFKLQNFKSGDIHWFWDTMLRKNPKFTHFLKEYSLKSPSFLKNLKLSSSDNTAPINKKHKKYLSNILYWIYFLKRLPQCLDSTDS